MKKKTWFERVLIGVRLLEGWLKGGTPQRERYYKFLNTASSDIAFTDWVILEEYTFSDIDTDVLDLAILPDNITTVDFKNCRINRLEISETLPRLFSLEAIACRIQDVRGLINLPVIAVLDLSYNALEELEVGNLPTKMLILILAGNRFSTINYFPSNFEVSHFDITDCGGWWEDVIARMRIRSVYGNSHQIALP